MRSLIWAALLFGFCVLFHLPKATVGFCDSSDRLATVYGGACEECKSNAGGTCTGTTCTGTSAPYEKKTGKMITPMSCAAVGKGKDGHTVCTLTDKKACFKYETCTGKNTSGECTGCSDKTLTEDEKKANEKPTKCSVSTGKKCTGT